MSPYSRKEKKSNSGLFGETRWSCCVSPACSSVLSGWMESKRANERQDFTDLNRLIRANPKSLLLSRLNFHACLASAAPPPVFLWPNNSLVFLFFTDSFLFLSPSERFHASSHRRSLWEHQRSNTAAQQRRFCGLQGQSE